jgi:hypothetical protein
MPYLCFAGDTHGQLIKMYAAVQEWMERTGVLVNGIVQVGDLGVFSRESDWSVMWNNRTPAPIPTWAIMGNHEDPTAIANWQKEPGRIPGMTLMPDGAIVDVLGVKIGCVWGNYSPKSWLNPERVQQFRAAAKQGSHYSSRIAMHIDRAAVDRLLAAPGPMDVLVTHDSASVTLPLCFRGHKMDPLIKELLGLTAEENGGGCPGFDELIEKFKPKHYFFGHLHCYDQGTAEATNWTCLNALGFPGGPWHQFVFI